MANTFEKRLDQMDSETERNKNAEDRIPASAKWIDHTFGFVFIFCCLMSGFTFCDRFVPDLATWWNSPRHCQCDECEWIRAKHRPTPPPAAMPAIRPNQRPLPPFQMPEI